MSTPLPQILAVIPARYASSRFPGKPLALIHGKPMLQHVWQRVMQLCPAVIQRVIIATDDDRIAQAAQAFGAEVQMTSAEHPSGTNRVWEVAQSLPEFDWVLNVQGDEPFLNPDDLKQLLASITTMPLADIITLTTPFQSVEAWQNPNAVKAVLAQNGQALYFSRAPIPYVRDNQTPGLQSLLPQNAFLHIGIYLFKRTALQHFATLPPSPLETLEKLEQLRALEAGMRIFATTVACASMGIDTPEDLALAQNKGLECVK